MLVRTFLQKYSHTLVFSGCFLAKNAKLHCVRRKIGPKSQADRSVRKADSAGRLDRDVSTNKRLKGLGFLREGGDRNPPSLRSPLLFLSGDAERNKKNK